MARVELFAEAADRFDALVEVNDPMVAHLEDVFDQLADDPNDLRLRRRMLTGPKRFICIVHAPGNCPDWMILWHPEADDEAAVVVVVDYIGESIF